MGIMKNKSTVVFGQSRDVVVAQIVNLINNVNGEYKDLEWDIEKSPNNTLYNNGQLLTKSGHRKTFDNNGYKYSDNYVERVSKTITNPNNDNVNQVIRGDGWFLPILSAAASIPGLIESIAVARKEDFCIYGFVFFKKDKWIGIVIDDYLFYKKQERTLLFSACNDPKITWVPLLEKAYAKCHKNYETIDRGCIRDVLVGFGGKDYKAYKTDNIKNNPIKKDKLWNSFPSDTKKNNSIFICHGVKVGYGLIQHHIYSIIRAVNFHNHYLVEVRNSLDHGKWKGLWSDERYNQEWSPWVIQKGNKRYIAELNYFLSDHDSFFMHYDDLLNQFDIIERCYYTPPTTYIGLDLTNKLVSSWWNGEYNIFYTNIGQNQPDLSIIKLKFSAQLPGDLNFLITSHGKDGTAYPKDGIGTYTIDEGQFNSLTKVITFTKCYVNCNHNVTWNYQGLYKHKLFFGTWGTENQPLGNFIIRRADKVKSSSLTGNWCGCYFYNLNDNDIDHYLMNLDFSGNLISGSGTDSVGNFKINGEILPNGSVGLIKKYTTHSWNYYGRIYGSEIYGRWGMIGTPNSGTFLMWKYE
ncbi:15871_t:CDS:2 [Cetraspora pellucida]|uniref:15871_t:CDS:1 n=1 Tax=Cetraspora pellucida TaxID=1433469 RepID=A0A9N8W9J8_9GLOM|nr:15871_t:CDS:2 [Cetraspora pellucida]